MAYIIDTIGNKNIIDLQQLKDYANQVYKVQQVTPGSGLSYNQLKQNQLDEADTKSGVDTATYTDGDYTKSTYGVTADDSALMKYIQGLADAQKASKVAGLTSARDNALSNLDAESATIKPTYYAKRNAAQAASDVAALNFGQYMANRGIKGNAGAMPEIYRNAGLQSQIGALNQAEAAANADIARRKTGINNTYESDVAAANAGVDATTMQNLINAYGTSQAQKIADLAALGKTSTGEDTLATVNANKQTWVDNIGQYSNDYEGAISTIANDNDTTNDWQIPYLRSAWNKQVQTKLETDATNASETWSNALKLWEASGTADDYISKILGVPKGALTADYNIDSINAQTAKTNAAKSGTSGSTDKTSDTDKVNAIVASFSKAMMTPEQIVAELENNSTDYVLDIGSTLYNSLLNDYKKKAGL